MNAPWKAFRGQTGLALFFIISLAISWFIWIPQALVALGYPIAALPLDSPLVLLATWGPGLAAIIVTLIVTGRAALAGIFASLFHNRPGFQWYAVLLLPPLVRVVGSGLDILMGFDYIVDSPVVLLGAEAAFMLPILILFSFPAALGEELGWRGFALPRLLEKTSPWAASVLLGLFWGLWHVPPLLAQGVLTLEALPVLGAILAPIPITLIYTWLYCNTNRSLLVVWLFHTSDAVTQYLLPRLPTYTDELLVLGIALMLLFFTGLQPRQRPALTHHRAI